MNEIRLNQLIKWYHKNEKLTILVDIKKLHFLIKCLLLNYYTTLLKNTPLFLIIYKI